MFGIIGYIGGGNAALEVYQGLKRLEYRGYDSAGGAFLNGDELVVVKKQGRVEKLLPFIDGLRATAGIGHTRWATHGAPSDGNAHPHTVGDISVVHNGIIENYAELKSELVADGAVFVSDTDSEVIAHLLNKFYDGDLAYAMKKTVDMLEGSYAILAVRRGVQRIYAACNKSPLIIGYGDGENFCASDEPALAGKCDGISVLDDGDFAEISADGVIIYDGDMQAVIREISPNLAVCENLGLGDCPHYMLKEIREVPLSVTQTVKAFAGAEQKLKAAFAGVDRIILTGCGTAYHAALLGKRYFEIFAKIPAETEIASEFRYKNPVIGKNTAVIAVSQSGETADTVEAARLARGLGARVIAVTNSRRSQLNRVADAVVPVAAGVEICVAATKSYTGQVAALLACAFAVAGYSYAEKAGVFGNIAELCGKVIENIDASSLAHLCSRSRGVYFLGRDLDYAVALEGSLKLKEISYVPGEGYPAGELKHGTLALIDENTVSVFLITDERLAGKCANAVEQVVSRGGRAAVITNVNGVPEKLPECVEHIILLPECEPYLAPFLTAVAVQTLAYRTAVILNRDPDKPRNLAKSVTVE